MRRVLKYRDVKRGDHTVVAALCRAQAYDLRYQFTIDGRGIAWLPGLAWPTMAYEEKYPEHALDKLSAKIDLLMAVIMMRAHKEWEKNHGR